MKNGFNKSLSSRLREKIVFLICNLLPHSFLDPPEGVVLWFIHESKKTEVLIIVSTQSVPTSSRTSCWVLTKVFEFKKNRGFILINNLTWSSSIHIYYFLHSSPFINICFINRIISSGKSKWLMLVPSLTTLAPWIFFNWSDLFIKVLKPFAHMRKK